MNKKDIASAHLCFSKYCFNKTWEFIYKDKLAEEEKVYMLSTAFTSLYHWKNRGDVTNQNLSVGYWQISRVFAINGDGSNASKFANYCLRISQKDDVNNFYLGYAYEALARSEMLKCNELDMLQYLSKANEICDSLIDKDEKNYLLADLNTIKL